MKNRILWVDWAKFLAIFAILVIHTSSDFIVSYPILTGNWFISLFFESITRWGVPVFIMVSGYLLLKKDYELTTFIKKRFTRVLLPFILWNIIYMIVKIGLHKTSIVVINAYSVAKFFVLGFLDPTIVTAQFWFVYMILGLYLITPIIVKWIRKANEIEINYLLIIWLIIMVLQLLNINFLLIDYLNLFTGFIGYFVLGYYIGIKKENSDLNILKNAKTGLLIFIIGFICIFIGTTLISYYTGSLSLKLISMGDLNPFALLESIGIFTILLYVVPKIKNKLANKIAIDISKKSYGIYLVNLLILNVLALTGIINNPILIFVYAIILLILSYIVITIMDKIPILKIFAGT